MAQTCSPRDHGVDANSEVSRKRARLTDSPTSNDDIPMEALEPECITPDYGDAIVIEGDAFSDMADSHQNSPGQTAFSEYREAEQPQQYRMRPADFERRLEGALEQYRQEVSGTAQQISKDDFNAIIDWLEKNTDAAAQVVQESFRQICDPAECMLAILNGAIFPRIRERHPGALPPNFHTLTVKIGMEATEVRATTMDHSPSDCYALYRKFVQGEHDMLLEQDANNEAGLEELCQGAPAIRTPLLYFAFALQADMKYIMSSIMDIRRLGVFMMCAHLLRVYHGFVARESMHDSQHAVPQYAIRFIKGNNLIGYIFGPESHASMILHCRDIVCFLAVTSTISNDELDVIWQTATTSVEAEFAKASYSILEQTCTHLGLDNLLHLAELYTTTPVDRIMEPLAAACLTQVFRKIHEHIEVADDAAREGPSMTITRTAIHFLQILHQAPPSEPTIELQQIVTAEINFAAHYPSDWRLSLYEWCLPAILEKTKAATAVYTTLAVMLRAVETSDEANVVLEKLPASVAVASLRDYVEDPTLRSNEVDFELGLRVRLGVVLLLLGFAPEAELDRHENTLFDTMLGECALDNRLRNVAWQELTTLTHSLRHARAAERLLKHYLDTTVSVMPAEFATPMLIDLMSCNLKEMIRRSIVSDPEASPLDQPLWKALVRFAVHVPVEDASKAAMEAICDLLFVWPTKGGAKDTLAQCHVRFVGDYVDWLCATYMDTPNLDAARQTMGFRQALRVLTMVLRKSRTVQPAAQLLAPMAQISLDGSGSDADALCFTVQTCSPQSRPQVTDVRANGRTTARQLLNALPEVTAAAASMKVIISGQQIDLEAVGHRTLSELGLTATGSIMICPTYDFDCNLDAVLTVSGPIEQELLAQYDRIEPFLDGSVEFAQCTFDFLKRLRASERTRARVCAADATVEQLFPHLRPLRVSHSSQVLHDTLQAYTKLGVADEAFITRSIRLLAAYVIDPRRDTDYDALPRVSACLFAFLNEMSKASRTPYLEDGALFSTRMIEVINRRLLFVKADDEPSALAHNSQLVLSLYKSVIQASRIDAQIWTSFAAHAGFAALHTSLWLHGVGDLSRMVIQAASNFCLGSEAPNAAKNDYWRAVLVTLPLALHVDVDRAAFFGLAVDLLNKSDAIRSSEDAARALITDVTSCLATYKHTEAPAHPIPDEAVIGMLQILGCAIVILKSFKKPLNLQDVGATLFDTLLFPPPESASPPVMAEETRGLLYDAIKATVETAQDYARLAQKSVAAIRTLGENYNEHFPGMNGWHRDYDLPAGLTNLSMTCYMNSLLQQLFANIAFRKFVLNIPIVETLKQPLLEAVQSLFANMQSGSVPCVATQHLVRVLGANPNTQEDVHYFYAKLLAQLEQELPSEDYKETLSTFFTGKFVTQIKGECGHISSTSEDFTDVPITVRNKANLTEGLQEFVQGEPMQGANKYRCMTCSPDDGGRLVNAMKRSCLEKTPDNVTFCLKRFAYESYDSQQAKVNDRFEFPPQIDLASYRLESLDERQPHREPDMFDLVGVVVHQGALDYGHYWSYVKIRNSADPPTWMKIEDHSAKRCENLEQMLRECYGGLRNFKGSEKDDNAYMLFYQRRSRRLEDMSLLKQARVSRRLLRELLPHVEMPTKMTQDIATYAAWRWRMGHVYSPQFAQFVEWLLGTSGRLPSASQATSDVQDTASNELELPQVHQQDAELLNTLSELAARYLLRVCLRDMNTASKTAALLRLVEHEKLANSTRESFVARLVTHMSDDPAFVAAIWMTPRAAFRRPVSRFLATCLRRWGDVGIYDEFRPSNETIAKLIAAHDSLHLNRIHNLWTDWFEFMSLANLARSVMEAGILDTVFEVLYIEACPSAIQARYPNMILAMKKETLNLTPLFSFLYEFLRKHVDLHDSGSTVSYTEHEGIFYLGRRDVENLYRCQPGTTENCDWWLLDIALKYTVVPANSDLVMFSPGKLYGHLLKKPPLEFLKQELDLRLIHSLVDRFGTEQHKLLPLLSMLLNHCCSHGNQSRDMVVQLSKEMIEWLDAYGIEIVRGFGECAKIARLSALEGMCEWVPAYLVCNKPQVREATRALLDEHMFLDPQPNPEETPARIRLARTMTSKFVPFLRTSYQDGSHRKCILDVFAVAQMTLRWLKALHREMEDIPKFTPPEKLKFSPKTLIECEESKSAIASLEQLFDDLMEWEMVTSLVTNEETAPEDLPSLGESPTKTTHVKYDKEVDEDEDDDEDPPSDDSAFGGED
ncbi:hypothetical protein LTR86_004366 [Recurvomyces mirabilis]|nr:hypothetical protein LTR86_004366 [Recurvomyces mirabilis]